MARTYFHRNLICSRALAGRAWRFRGELLALFVVAVALSPARAVHAQPTPNAPLAPLTALPPHGDDYSAGSLRSFIDSLNQRYGSTYRDMPLDVKAEFFEWELWRYHRTPYRQIYNRARLPEAAGPPPVWLPGPDSSTWNGALLGALSFKYATTRDPQTLSRIEELLRGLRLFFEVTGIRGLPARNVTPEGGPVEPDQKLRYQSPDGVRYAYRSEAAKGTINQLVGGYLTLLLYVGAALPAESYALAKSDLVSMALHVIDHDYRLTEADGSRTPYGDLTPLVGSVGVPFNAQVAYLVVAAAQYFPPDDPSEKQRIAAAYHRLRHKHHVYYEEPLSLVAPQRVGGSTFVKGMNDRNHVTYAAFLGVMLDVAHARQHGQPFDEKLAHQLGQTVAHSMELLGNQHNSLCDFEWAALVNDADIFHQLQRHSREATRRRADLILADGIEQLRRFKLDRFVAPGREVEVADPTYNDAHFPDDYYWKVNPNSVFQPTGPPTTTYACAIDYLHAYWLLRFYKLDANPVAVRYHAAALRPTPGFALGGADL